MGILSNLTDEIKNAMRAKDSLRLEALRAIKSGILLLQTRGSGTKELNDDDSIRLLQRLVKQRKESAAIYREQEWSSYMSTIIVYGNEILRFYM